MTTKVLIPLEIKSAYNSKGSFSFHCFVIVKNRQRFHHHHTTRSSSYIYAYLASDIQIANDNSPQNYHIALAIKSLCDHLLLRLHLHKIHGKTDRLIPCQSRHLAAVIVAVIEFVHHVPRPASATKNRRVSALPIIECSLKRRFSHLVHFDHCANQL